MESHDANASLTKMVCTCQWSSAIMENLRTYISITRQICNYMAFFTKLFYNYTNVHACFVVYENLLLFR